MAKKLTYRIDHFTGLNSVGEGDTNHTPGESADMLNFRITPGGKLEKRQGFETVFPAPEEDALRGMWCGALGDESLFAAVFGETLYASSAGFDSLEPVSGTVPGEGKMNFFPFLGELYLLTGDGILHFDGGELCQLEPYVPLLSTATAPNGSGTLVDEVNLLTDRVIQSFVPDGLSDSFVLAIKEVEEIEKICRGNYQFQSDEWYWNNSLGGITFVNTPPVGSDEIEIHYRFRQEGDQYQQIMQCRYACAFGGANDTRVFLYGSDSAPAMRFHSGMREGSPAMDYFPALGYTLVGDGSPITGILRHYNRQLIFTEKAAYYSYLEYATTEDGRQRALFPVLPLSDDRGSVPRGQLVLMENEPCTLNASGLFRWVSTNVRDERNAQCFSLPVQSYLEGKDLAGALLFNRKSEGELWVVLGEEILVYQYTLGCFYRYEISPAICHLAEFGGETYFGTEEGICQMGGTTDDGSVIRAYWYSHFLDLGSPEQEKNLFSVSLCADTSEYRSACYFRLIYPQDGGTALQQLVFANQDRANFRRVYAVPRHFERIQLYLGENGYGPLHLVSVTMRGRVCDNSI